jgi:mRNA-binding protein PUF3
MNQSPNSKSYLDPSSAAGFDSLDFANGSRGRSLEVAQGFTNSRFPGASTPNDTGDRRHFGAVLVGAIEGEDAASHAARGRVVSNPRGVVPPNTEMPGNSVSSAGRSESLPPQQRANSTPPTYDPGRTPSEATGGYGAYTHVPTSHPNSHAHNPSYPVPGRYTDLSRDTRDAEMLAQFRQISVEDETDQFPERRRAPYGQLGQALGGGPGNLSYPSQPTFGDYPPYQARQTIPQNSSVWGPEDGSFPRGQDGLSATEQYSGDTYVDAYNDFRRPYDRIGAMSPGDQSSEYSKINPGSQYHANGSAPPPQVSDFRSTSRGAPVRTPPSGNLALNHEKLRQRLLVTQQQQQQNPHLTQNQIMLRDPLYRGPYQVQPPYDYNYNGGLRLPIAPYPGSPISQLVPPTHPAARRTHDDFGHNMRSQLLEEFRSNSKSNKRYELKVINNTLRPSLFHNIVLTNLGHI